MNNDKQHLEDTKYKQWQDGMYVMFDDLECDYEKALVENSLRGSVYYFGIKCFTTIFEPAKCYGVLSDLAGAWISMNSISNTTKLTRAQALYIATGDTDI
jgi:hypothetical protein